MKKLVGVEYCGDGFHRLIHKSKTYHIVHFNYVQFILCKLYLKSCKKEWERISCALSGDAVERTQHHQ